MFGRTKPQVLIAGAGPVGLFSALYLAKNGIRVELVEEAWRGSTHSYAVALHPWTLELLANLGVAEAILARARRVHSIAVYDGAERRAHVDLARLDAMYPFIAVLSQSDLEGVLSAALRQSKIEVEWGQRLARIEQSAEAVTATVDKLDRVSTGYAVAHEETEVVHSRKLEISFLIGADGHSSVARQQLPIRFDQVGPAENFAVVEFESEDAVESGEMRIVLDDAGSGVLWPMPDNHMRWSLQLDPGITLGDSREKSRLLMEFGERTYPHLEIEHLEDLVKRRAPWFDGELSRVRWRIAVRFERRLASAFGQGRIWLAGDAAHLTSPSGAQSMNVGLKEGAELCRMIVGVLKGDFETSMLSAYGRSAHAEWRFLLGLETPGLSATDVGSPWIKQRAERLIACIPASGSHFDQIVAELGLERVQHW